MNTEELRLTIRRPVARWIIKNLINIFIKHKFAYIPRVVINKSSDKKTIERYLRNLESLKVREKLIIELYQKGTN